MSQPSLTLTESQVEHEYPERYWMDVYSETLNVRKALARKGQTASAEEIFRMAQNIVDSYSTTYATTKGIYA